MRNLMLLVSWSALLAGCLLEVDDQGDLADPGDVAGVGGDEGGAADGANERGLPCPFVNGEVKSINTPGAADIDCYVWLSAGQTATVRWTPGFGSGNGDLYVALFAVAGPDNYLWSSTNPGALTADQLTFGASANSPPLKYFVNLHSTTHIAGGLKATW